MREREHVRGGDVGDVHVIADARAVRRRVRIAEHQQLGAIARGDVERERDEMRLRIVPLARLAVRVRTGGVEVAQRDEVERARRGDVLQDPLDHELRAAIGAQRTGGRVLVQVAIRRRIERAAAREHEAVDAARAQCGEQRARRGNVVAPVEIRLAHRIADVARRRHVDARNRLLRVERRIERLAIRDVRAHQRAPAHGIRVPRAQVVERDRHVARLRERLADVRADVAGAARDQDGALAHALRSITVSPSTSMSIFVRRKQSSASSGLQTIGSFSLNDVFSTIGTPVSRWNARMSCA